MMIAQILVPLLFLLMQVCSLPTSNSTEESTASSVDYSIDGVPHYRSLWSIVYSCLITTYASTWLSIHPNVPASQETYRVVIFRRVKIALLALLAPHVVLFWAARQYFTARSISRTFKMSMTHAFGISMGLFAFIEVSREKHQPIPATHELEHFSVRLGDDISKDSKCTAQQRVMTRPSELSERDLVLDPLSESQSGVPFPDYLPVMTGKQLENFPAVLKEIQETRKESIMDRSKGDALAKAFASVQTTWFVVEFIVRITQGLHVTKLEVEAVAFAVLNAVTYGFWWHKPLSVRYPIVVNTQAVAQPTLAPYPYGDISQYPRLVTQAIQMLTGAYACDPSARRVPTLWASEHNQRKHVWIQTALAVGFGLIHCAAWIFPFPTKVEKTLWLVATASIILVPILLLLIFDVLCRELYRRRGTKQFTKRGLL